MKILLLNCVYREGSTGKIVASIADTLRGQGHEVLTCYGLGKSDIDEFSVKVCSNFEHKVNAVLKRLTGIPYGGVFFSNCRIKKIVRDFNPDVVHIHCVNASTINVYNLLKWLAKKNLRTVLTLHAEIFHTAGCEHAFECEKWKTGCNHCEQYKQKVGSWLFDRSKASYKKMYDAVNSFSRDRLTVTAVSPWLADRAKQSAIMKNYDVVYIPNGVDTSVFHHRECRELIDREHYKKVVLFVTPYFGMEETDVKGGRYLPLIAKRLTDYKFIVVTSCHSASLPAMPTNMQLWGRAKTQEELSQLYSEADMTLLLSKRETFSMVTAESLSCGTPVVGFKAGGPESIAPKDKCSFVEYGDLEGVVKTCESLINTTNESVDSFKQDLMTNKYLNLYSK